MQNDPGTLLEVLFKGMELSRVFSEVNHLLGQVEYMLDDDPEIHNKVLHAEIDPYLIAAARDGIENLRTAVGRKWNAVDQRNRQLVLQLAETPWAQAANDEVRK